MTHSFGWDVAALASNLAERTRIVTALDTTADGRGLDGFGSWRIDRLAGKLAGQVPRTKQEIVDILTAFECCDVGDERVRRLLADVHDSWLPTYRAALEHFEPTGVAAGWRHADTYYGRLAVAGAPFLAELGRELDAVRARHAGTGRVRVAPGIVEDLQGHLLDRFELSLAWAVEADANVYCAQRGIDKAGATAAQFRAYLDSRFLDAGSHHRFYLAFPVLGRWLAQVTRLVADYGRELIDHLVADAADIAATFFGREIVAFLAIRPGRSDYHAGARSVAFVEVELAGGDRGTFVYKPRCVRSEAAMQRLLALLAGDGVLGFATRGVLPRDGYGYEALIPAGHNRVESEVEAERIYAELGGYLGIFYVLGGGDLHFENVLVADGHAFVCDCETVLGVELGSQARAPGTIIDSVFRTGLLEWPRRPDGAGGLLPGVRLSGYAGGEAFDLPIPVPQVTGSRLTFQTTVRHRTGVHVQPDAANRVFLGDTLIQPRDFTGAITRGFDRVYEWFQRQPEHAIRLVSDLFAGTRVRFINWNTQMYAQLLISARHPKYLTDPLETDVLTSVVRGYPRIWDGDGVLATRELASLWRLDVPIFTMAARGRQLVHDHADAVAVAAEISPLDGVVNRIGWLSDRNRVQQSQYITASLSSGQIHSPAFVESCMDHARRIGRLLCELLREPSAAAPWVSYRITAEGKGERDIDADLYVGSAGIVLFLAYLDHLVPDPDVRRAARRGLAHAVSHCDRQRMGVFQGLSGLIYLLVHLHHLWGEDILLDQAIRLSADLQPLIGDDTSFDVLSGAAGTIPVLLGLAGRADGYGLDLAHRCARHLLDSAEAGGGTVSWQSTEPGDAVANLTGFAHGTAGIGWALTALGCHTGRPEYIDAARQAFAYEARHFDRSEEDWYDLRTSAGGIRRNGHHFANAWCNGAAGIGLSRISCWAMLGKTDNVLLREAHLALAATMRNFPLLQNDTLCHGRSGNAELLLRFAVLDDEPAFQLEANVQVQTQWRNVEQALNGRTASGAGFFPGLMIGMSGFGMHFLRLAHPDRVPSVLLLDPPAGGR